MITKCYNSSCACNLEYECIRRGNFTCKDIKIKVKIKQNDEDNKTSIVHEIVKISSRMMVFI